VPELPDVTVYVEALRERIVGRRLERILIRSPFVLRSVEPPVEAAEGKVVVEVCRLGKRIVIGLEDGLFLVIHLMIAGRLLWKPAGSRPRGRIDLAAMDYGDGVLVLTEAGTTKRASIHLVSGQESLAAHDPGGLDIFSVDAETFGAALRRENHTLKRVLTDPQVLSGIGNAYSDEILHAARLSPLRLSRSLSNEEISRLLTAAQNTLNLWTDRLGSQLKGHFPGVGEVTAFHDGFAVHGRYGKPCPVCGHKVQRIRYAENETNYCPTCQVEGRLLADRSLSRLLKKDWPRTVEDLKGG
jgi:formamidopyrimidine-DNA glycosylase